MVGSREEASQIVEWLKGKGELKLTTESKHRTTTTLDSGACPGPQSGVRRNDELERQ